MSYSRRSRRYSPSPSPYDRYCPSLSPPRGRSMSRSRSRSRESDSENPGNNLYVTGLSSRVTTRDLEKFFSSEGKVEDIHLVRDPRTRESRGFGFVTMSTMKEANRCIRYLDGTVLEGRVITVEKARRSRGRTPTPGKYLGLRASRGRHRSRSYSPYSSDENERSFSRRSSHYSRDRSCCPRHGRSRISYSPSPVPRHSRRYDSPSYKRRSRSPYSRRYSPRPRSSRRRQSRSYSPRNRREGFRNRNDSYSPYERRRSYSSSRSPSGSYSPIPNRGRRYSSPNPRSRRSPSGTYSPILNRGRRYSSPDPRRRRRSPSSDRLSSPNLRRERSYSSGPRSGTPSDSYSLSPSHSRSVTPQPRNSDSNHSTPSRSKSVSRSSGSLSSS